MPSGDLAEFIYWYTGRSGDFFRLASEAVKLRHWGLYILKNYEKFFPAELSKDARWKVLLGEAGL